MGGCSADSISSGTATAPGSPLPRQTNRCAYHAAPEPARSQPAATSAETRTLTLAIISEVGGSGSVISVHRSDGDSAIDLRRPAPGGPAIARNVDFR